MVLLLISSNLENSFREQATSCFELGRSWKRKGKLQFLSNLLGKSLHVRLKCSIDRAEFSGMRSSTKNPFVCSVDNVEASCLFFLIWWEIHIYRGPPDGCENQKERQKEVRF